MWVLRGMRRGQTGWLVAALMGMGVFVGTWVWVATRPALVWWVSPEIGKTGRHVRVLVPRGWEERMPIDSGDETTGELMATYAIGPPMDRRPKFLRWMFPHNEAAASMEVLVCRSRPEETQWVELGTGITKLAYPDGSYSLDHSAVSRDARVMAFVTYHRTDARAFDATYKKICGSLRVE
jgi:hypothetical protein